MSENHDHQHLTKKQTAKQGDADKGVPLKPAFEIAGCRVSDLPYFVKWIPPTFSHHLIQISAFFDLVCHD